MRRRCAAALALALALAAGAVGCGARQRRPELIDDVRRFGDGVRWRKHDQAAAHLPVRERLDFVAEREDLDDDLRIGDWEVERIVWQVPGRRALVRVSWTWHLDSRGLVHRTTSEQRWELVGERWLMVAEERRRGEPMPGLAEPAKPPRRRTREVPAETPAPVAAAPATSPG